MNNPYKNKEKQVLYFIYDPNTKLHKIGIATSQFRFERRFKALKIRYHYGPQLKIILTKVNSKEIIRELEKKILSIYKKNKCLRTMSVEHYINGKKVGKKLNDQKMNGGTEWFSFNNKEITEVKKIIKDC